MALPVLNDKPKYELTIPSSGKKVKYRPYLVKEEKVLYYALESNDPNQFLVAAQETLNSCFYDKLDRLTTFDLEYMFLKLRSKSVGENVNLSYTCQNCEKPMELNVDIDSVECSSSGNVENVIKLNDDISVEMRYPSYENLDLSGESEDMGFALIANSLGYVITEEEKIDVSEESNEQVRAFVESLTSGQFQKLTKYIETIPNLRYESEEVCPHCGHKNKIELQGLQSFF